MKLKFFKILLALILFLMFTVGIKSHIYAQELDQATDSTKTTLKLKERIERIVEEKKDQVKGIISDITSTKQGFVGEVIRVTQESITVKTNKATRIIPITPDVKILKDNKEISVEDIAVENWAVVMGILEEDTFKAIRILISPTTLRPRPHIIILGSINALEKTLVTITPRSGEEPLSALLNSKTIYEDINGQEILRTDIQTDTQALIIIYEDKGSKITKRIRILTVIQKK